jgi:hypothetical protein
MKPSPARHCDWRSALRGVDDADIISLAEAHCQRHETNRGSLYDPIYDLMEIDAQTEQDQG